MALRCRIRFSPKNTQGAVVQTAGSTHRNSNNNLYVRYLYWNGDRWNWNYNWLDNNFNSNNPAALAIFFISLPWRGSFVL